MKSACEFIEFQLFRECAVIERKTQLDISNKLESNSDTVPVVTR